MRLSPSRSQRFDPVTAPYCKPGSRRTVVPWPRPIECAKRTGGQRVPGLWVLANHPVAEVRDAGADDDRGIAEHHRRVLELGEQRHTRAEQHCRKVDVDLVE